MTSFVAIESSLRSDDVATMRCTDVGGDCARYRCCVSLGLTTELQCTYVLVFEISLQLHCTAVSTLICPQQSPSWFRDEILQVFAGEEMASSA